MSEVKESIEEHSLPPELIEENATSISNYTFSRRAHLWMASMAENMVDIRRGGNLLDLKDKYGGKGSAIVIGGGPSLEKFKHLDLLAESGYKGTIIATDKELIPCLKLGVIPHIVITVDGDPRIAQFYDDPLVDKYASGIDAVFCCNSVHPEVVRRWRKASGGDPSYFIAIWDDPVKNPKSLTRMIHFMTGKMMLQCGGNAGHTAWQVAYFLGRNPIALIGMDLGYSEEDDLTKTPYYRTFEILTKEDMEAIARSFRKGYNPSFKNYYYTDLFFEAYLGIFRFFIPRANTTTINCTEQGALHLIAPNFKCMKLHNFLKKYKR